MAISELDIPRALARVLRRAVSHEARERYQAAGDFIEAFVSIDVEDDSGDYDLPPGFLP